MGGVDLVFRFWDKVLVGDECWEWQAAFSGPYGSFSLSNPKRRVGAHRVAWELWYGPIPDGIDVLHHCDYPPCVRPSHLFLGTAVDNSADAMQKGRLVLIGDYHHAKTHCPQGHEYTPENTYITKEGWRQCQSCRRTHRQERKRCGR